MYTGHLEVSFLEAPAVLSCAATLGLPGLRQAAARAVWEELKGNVGSLSDVLEITSRHGAEAVRELCIEALAENLASVASSEQFAALSPALREAVEHAAAEMRSPPT